MIAAKYFKIPFEFGTFKRNLFVYKTENSEYDLQYRWKDFSSGLHQTLEATIADFRSLFLEKYGQEFPDHSLIVGEPSEVTWEEVSNCDQADR